jgi:putative addiction module killer protein
MFAVRRTPEFNQWLRHLRDARAQARVTERLHRLAAGNPGDVKPVGEGLSEMRIDIGPGYRVYYCRHGDDLVVLYGGDKDTQDRDIRFAQALARALED